MGCLKRMGPAAAPALPLVREELARPDRGDRYGGAGDDEALLRDLAGLLAPG